MSELLDRSIAVLRTQHARLEAVVAGLSPEQLRGESGATEWSIAQVLSHLGSGAEITLGTITAADQDNQSIWDRWNAASPQEQASWFVEHDERLVTMLEALSPEQRDTMTVQMFLPDPVTLEVAVGMRLSEVAAHAWDVRVGLDSGARLDDESAALLAEHLAGGLAFLLGFSGRADQLSRQAIVRIDGYELVIDEGVRMVQGAAEGATATFRGPLEAAVRMLSGRLQPEYTPENVSVTGNVTLEDLRRVFPGY